MGVCAPALILPSMNIVSGSEPMPLPSLDLLGGICLHKRSFILIPLLVGLGVTGGLTTYSAGLGIALDKYDYP